MSMWKRLQRAVSSNLERFRDDPLGTLKADLVGLNADLDTIREQVRLLEQDLARLVQEENRLSDAIRAALTGGDRERGLDLATRVSEVRRDKVRVERQLESARRVVARISTLEQSLHEAEAAAPLSREDELVIKVRAKETLSQLERELGAPEVPAPARPAPGGVNPGKTLGGGSELAAEGIRRSATKTLGGSQIGARPEPPAAESLSEGASQIVARPSASGEKTLGGSEAAGETEGLDLVAELERLAQLKESGALSDEEFLLAKQRLLGQ